MTEPTNRVSTNPARPFGPVSPAAGDVVEGPEATDEHGRLGKLPEHEVDDDATVGGGVMSEGGTAIDRGTGTLTGQAQGTPPDDDDALSGPDDEPGDVQPSPLTQR